MASSRRALQIAASAALFILLAPGMAGLAAARPRELEVRGTLLCRAEGDPHRERPADPRGIVIEPVGYAASTEMVGEAGLFRLRLPYDIVDRELVLKIYRGSEPIDVFTVFIEPAKVKRVAEKYVYATSSHVLPGRCEELTANTDAALEFRDHLRNQAIPVQAAGFRLPKSALSGIVAALIGGGAYAAQAGTASNEDISGQIVSSDEFPMRPGFFTLYSQFSSAPMLGRTLTSFRNPEQAAFWNPSLLVLTAGNHIGGSGGVRNEWRGSAAWRIPYKSESVPVWLPRIVSAGFLGIFWDREQDRSVPGISRDILEHRHEENLALLGLGFALGQNVGMSVSLHNYHQKFGTVETVSPPEGDSTSVYDSRLTRDEKDVDLGLTWEPSEELRVGVAAYSIGGTEGWNADKEQIPQSRGVVGASWIRDRFQVGGEFGLNAGEMNVAAGVNYRLTALVALDLAGSSRWETLQAGLDFTPGPVTGIFRVRWDDREEAAVHLGVGLGW